jgi:hypothetical protein
LGWVGIAFLLAGTSCSHSPEGFCKSWVEETCTTIAGCCRSGTDYDVEECRVSLSQSCEQGVAVEKVHSGELVFDNGAANDCFGSVEVCSDVQAKVSDDSFDHVKACANVLTGFRPLGAACSSSSQCEKSGEFTACYDGNGGGNSGVCAKVVLDEAACSFAFDTNELHVCPDGTFCDLSGFKASINDPPTIQDFEFTAKCRNKISQGGTCINKGLPLPCAEGLFCDNKATCSKVKTQNATCQGSKECAVGLDCLPDKNNPGLTCQVAGGPFCFSISKCGDGICNGNESANNCPQDCSQCGDGICDTNEDPQSCPADCGGAGCNFDGFCDTGETPTNCPSDCGGAGCNFDGFCDTGESPQNCPSDCFCGDGVCSQGETINNCPNDC